MQKGFAEGSGAYVKNRSGLSGSHWSVNSLKSVRPASPHSAVRPVQLTSCSATGHCNAASTLQAEPRIISNNNGADTIQQYDPPTPIESYSKASIKVRGWGLSGNSRIVKCILTCSARYRHGRSAIKALQLAQTKFCMILVVTKAWPGGWQ